MHTGREAWSRLSQFRFPSSCIYYFSAVWYPNNERFYVPCGSSRMDAKLRRVFSTRGFALRSYGWMFAEVVACLDFLVTKEIG